MKKILILGALGQLGTELSLALQEKYGIDNVILADIKKPDQPTFLFEEIDVLDEKNLEKIVQKHRIQIIYHLAAMLSANGEKNPLFCWQLNMQGFLNVLEVARKNQVEQVIHPSSIAVFGPETPKKKTPQETIILPKTMYGITKFSAELLADYYVEKYGLDVRGVRYPGLIGYKSLPGGGTTDYAVAIFYEALLHQKYTCFLKKDTILPMMYLPDAVKGTLKLAETPLKNLKHHSNFNFAAISFSPEELAQEIRKHIPNFEIIYEPDFRQDIADSWPSSIDDTVAREEWHWEPEFNLEKMVIDMLKNLKIKLNIL